MTPQQIEMALETIALVLEDLKKTQEKQQATITALEEALTDHAMREVQRLGQEIEQEPVAWLDGPHLVVRSDMRDRLNYKGPWVDLGRAIPDKWTPLLYTFPPQRTWVGLTGIDQKELMAMSARDAVFATEAKLKEKNT